MIEPPSFVRGNACCGRPLLKVRQICENVEFLGTQSRRLVLIGVSPRAQGVRRGRGGNGPGFRSLAMQGRRAVWIGEVHGEQHAQ